MSPILSFFGGSRATSVFARNSHGARGLRASVPVEGTEERETLRRDVLSAAEEEGGKKHSIDSRSLPSLDLPLASLPRPPFGLPSSTSTEKKKKSKQSKPTPPASCSTASASARSTPRQPWASRTGTRSTPWWSSSEEEARSEDKERRRETKFTKKPLAFPCVLDYFPPPLIQLCLIFFALRCARVVFVVC